MGGSNKQTSTQKVSEISAVIKIKQGDVTEECLWGYWRSLMIIILCSPLVKMYVSIIHTDIVQIIIYISLCT